MGSNKGYDLIGQTFGRLTVLQDTGERHKKRGKVWLCQCECGELTRGTTSHLKAGNKQSCGCLAIESRRRKTNNIPTSSGERKISNRTSSKMETKPTKKLRNEIPHELLAVPSRMVEDGQFQVFINGQIFRHDDRGVLKCHIGKANGYKLVNGYVDGKQKPYYVHRLLAKAFIPNPENKPLVVFEDNDRSNLKFENLVWSTKSERAKKTYESRDAKFYDYLDVCKKCNGNTRNEDGVCSKCQYEINKKKNHRRIVEGRVKRVSDIRLDLITPKQREAVKMVSSGKSLNEVAVTLGVTRQGVDSLIQSARRRIEKMEIKNNRENLFVSRRDTAIEDTNDLKTLRILNDLTLEEVAKYLGITGGAYRRKEDKPDTIKIREAIKLAKLFDKSIEELFDSH